MTFLPKLLIAVMIAGSSLTIGGCARSEMQFHFAAADLDADKPSLTFYRVTVRGECGASTSHLLTGFYSADAVHALFGKVEDKLATGGDLAKSGTTRVGSIVVQYDPISRSWHVVEDNQRFTVFWGTNADAMAQQVGAFSESIQTGDDLASLIAALAGREKFDGLRTAQRTAEDKEASRGRLADTLQALQKELEGAEKDANGNVRSAADYSTAVQSILRRAAQAGLIQAGSSTVLKDTFKDALTQTGAAIDALEASKKE